MKKKDLDELKNKGISDLKIEIKKLQKEAIDTLLELKIGKIKNVHAYNQKRKDIARVKTVLKMKGLAQSVPDAQSKDNTQKREDTNAAG